MKWTRLIIKTVTLCLVAGGGAYVLRFSERARLQSQIDDLERERQALKSFVQRLRAERRVAQVEILDQYTDRRGRTVNILRWQEISADGTLRRPLQLTVLGRQVYFEGWVIKFDYDFVESNDPDKGSSVVLFRRVFGDEQTAQSADEFDRTQALGRSQHHGADQPDQLWQQFWYLVDDVRLRRRYGVRVAQCEAPAVRVRQGQIWRIDLAAAGGLNVTKAGDYPPLATNKP